MLKRLLVGVAFLTLGAFALQAQSSSTQSGSQSGTQQQYGTQPSDQGKTQDQGSSSQSQSSNPSNKLSSTDREFVRQAFLANQREIQMGQLAQQKSSNNDVKQYAQQLIDDHTKANDQLQQIASNKGINLPSQSKQSMAASHLSNLSGANFDRQFVIKQRQAHRKAIAMFQREANNGQDPDLKSFASSQMSALQQHETMANDLSSKMSSSRASGNQPSNSLSSSSSSSSQYGNQNPDQSASDNMPSDNTSSSSSSTSTSTSSKSRSTTQQLPRTASNLPLIGLFGFMLIGAALIARSFRLLRKNR